MFKKTLLDNGIRVVAEKIPSVRSVSIGMWIAIGSRDEREDEHGISHFLEHMFFKGTERRSAKEIALEIDAIGGELNAFTSRETTTFYAKVLDEHLAKAVEILSDNFHHSRFDPREIGKEKQVVMEEIRMVEDDPEDLVHDLYTAQMWRGNPLGRTILGTTGTIGALSREKIIGFLRRNYHPSSIVLSVAGHFDHDRLIKRLDAAFGSYRQEGESLRIRETPSGQAALVLKKRRLEQVHLCFGTRGLPQNHPDRYALTVLNSVIGGSVSSRLFQEIRERRGLAYSIYSDLSSFEDAGLFTVYAAASRKSASQVTSLIAREFRKIREKGIGPEELKKAKNQIKGSVMLAMESTSARMSKLAREEIYFGRNFSLEEIIAEVERVSVGQVIRLAQEVFDPRAYSLVALGPLSRKEIPEDLFAA